MHSHPSRTSCATSAVRRRNCLSSSALARGRVRIPEPNLRRMRLGFLSMRRCYTNQKTKMRKSDYRDFIRQQLEPRQKYRGNPVPQTGSDKVERARTSSRGDFADSQAHADDAPASRSRSGLTFSAATCLKNDEIQSYTKFPLPRDSSFVLRASFDIRHSSVVISQLVTTADKDRRRPQPPRLPERAICPASRARAGSGA